jgi:hypothetical protein
MRFDFDVVRAYRSRGWGRGLRINVGRCAGVASQPRAVPRALKCVGVDVVMGSNAVLVDRKVVRAIFREVCMMLALMPCAMSTLATDAPGASHSRTHSRLKFGAVLASFEILI